MSSLLRPGTNEASIQSELRKPPYRITLLKHDPADMYSAWICCNGVAQIVGALMMYGIGGARNVVMANWRVMFLVCGGGTIAVGILFVLLMPIGPETAWFLTPDEREIATHRLAEDRLNKEAAVFKKHQMFEAFLDPKVYLFCGFAFFGTMAGPVLKVRMSSGFIHRANPRSSHLSSSLASALAPSTLCW